MRYLIDTHALIWFLAGSNRLGSQARAIIERPESDIFISIASLWEITIKHSQGKLELAVSLEELTTGALSRNHIEILPIRPTHLQHLATLPFHHRDPFDRAIAAQSIVEKMPLVSVDAIFDTYNVERLWK